MSNPYDAPFATTSRYASGNTKFSTKTKSATGRTVTQNPYNQPFNATGDAPNQDYSKPAAPAAPTQTSAQQQRIAKQKNNPTYQKMMQAKPALDAASGKPQTLISKYNPINIATQVPQAVNKVLVQPFTNTAKAPVNAITLAGNELAHNDYGIEGSTKALNKSSTGSLFGPLANLAVMGGTAAAGRSILNNKKTSPEVKDAQIKQAVSPSLHSQGFDINDSGLKTGLKEASLAGQALSVPLLSKGGMAGLKSGRQALAGKAGSIATAEDAKTLLTNSRTHTLLDKAHNTPDAPEYTPSNPKVKTLVEARQRQAEAAAAPMKAAAAEQSKTAATAEKTAAQGQKIDRQVELLQAKQKDAGGELSNVDKTKLQHLQEDKQNLAAPTRPNDELQTKIEQAHNAGDTALEKQLTDQLPDQGMNPNASLSAEAKQALMDKARAKAASETSQSDPIAQLKQEALQHNDAEDFVKNVHQKIENPANGKSFTQLAREYDLPKEDIQTLDTVEKLRWSKEGPKSYPAAAEQLGLGKEYERITNQISREGDKRYVNPYGNTGILGDTYTSQKLRELHAQAHAEAKTTADAATTPTAKPAGEAVPEPAPKATEPSAKPASASSEASVAPTERNTNTGAASEPVTRTAGSALHAEARAVQKGLVKEFKGKGEYSGGSYKEEAAKAVDLVEKDPQKAMDIAMGKTPGDNTIHEVAVAQALENKALKAGDVETLTKLASSNRHSVTSEAAQRLGAEGYGEQHSVVKSLATIRKVRQDAFEKRTGKTAATAVSDEVKQIRAAQPKVTAKTWSDFLDGIKC